jgi:hypothetical protein
MHTFCQTNPPKGPHPWTGWSDWTALTLGWLLIVKNPWELRVFSWVKITLASGAREVLFHGRL